MVWIIYKSSIQLCDSGPQGPFVIISFVKLTVIEHEILKKTNVGAAEIKYFLIHLEA